MAIIIKCPSCGEEYDELIESILRFGKICFTSYNREKGR